MATKELNLEDLKTEIEAMPDEHDGVDLRQYKRQALTTTEQLQNQLTVVRKLAK